MALAKKHRLTKKDLDRLFKQEKTVKNSFFFTRFLKNDVGYLRVAAVVPVRILKKATERNYLKRLVTESIQTGHFLEKSYDIVIIATLDIVGKQPKEIKRDLEQTIKKVFGQ